ncbi:deoxyribonuclease IV [Halothermothrix orenii]|uniref:Probable endonuclease 4 n=1 Tax=Halothermothrix orenii (strain H 168 / OCM 544 / DSM 9562) TaxID=373903 RepID=END4_HALOH|nr:deoxyribonuclease IV [Halothermothrix orenii]B8CW79.1 RecName: Full=Probable endonuclease 4; AltName: Full=Endodeoxyribonuclease IV; AltName: Full=Endonuclease IV [Halothermothrix orenii H 168]ACL69548.1 apurinic endonuclease Apn1 [Halothermothrix orenii H 168]
MRLGKHVSIAGGLYKATDRATKIGCNALQIFVKNPRGWKIKEVSDSEIKKLKDNIKKENMYPLVVHSSYLINMATPRDELWEKSVNSLKKEYKRTELINADYFVVHPGSHTGKGLHFGINRIIEAINSVFGEVKNGPQLLLENVAGAGSSIGSNFTELRDIINKVDDYARIGVCLDTCHAFAAGYDLRYEDGLEELLNDFDKIIGLDLLKVIHLNDSKYGLASNKDEHAHIGEGEIGEKGISNIINHPLLKDKPFILETPKFSGRDKDVELVNLLRRD